MNNTSHIIAGLPRRPLAVLLLLAMVVAIVSQLLPRTSPASTRAAPNPPAASFAPSIAGGDPIASQLPAVAPVPSTIGTDSLAPADTIEVSRDLKRIRADVAFWGGRFAESPGDFVSAIRLAASEVELARATGDLTAYLAANAAVDGALAAYPTYGPALDFQGVIQIALHQFEEARASSTAILATNPSDPAALATLGDATLELGDVDAAADAFRRLRAVDASAASLVRTSHLAFIQGRTADAVKASRAAVAAARRDEGVGNGLAWFQYQLGDTLIATGDRAGAKKAYMGALRSEPRSHLARWGLARVAAADGDLDEAIAQLDRAIAIIPLPQAIARRADLYRLRGADGDTQREENDRKTVLAIAQLAGSAANVYDRILALYLAGSGNDPARALILAENEIAIRRDVYGYDALAWALLANDRPAEADEAMTTALAFGTRDAKLLGHAGMIAAALHQDDRARTLLGQALDLDPSYDPLEASIAQATLEGLQ
jgi:Flp pilus assembly protein TadD